jgi:hypothetical protein
MRTEPNNDGEMVMGNVISAAEALLEKRREEFKAAFIKQCDEVIERCRREREHHRHAQEAVVPFRGGHLSEWRQQKIEEAWRRNQEAWAEEERRRLESYRRRGEDLITDTRTANGETGL